MICDLARPKKGMSRTLRLKMGMFRHCAIELNCPTLRDPKQIYCDFARPKTDILRLCAHGMFARFCPTQEKQHFANMRDQSDLCEFARARSRFAIHVSTVSTQARYFSIDPNQGVYDLTMFER